MSKVDQSRLTTSGETLAQNHRREQAVFIGWQRTRSGAIYPLYNVIAEGHPYFGSTVSDQTLRRLNLDVPTTPAPANKL
jgi:hypothetical protein